MEIKKMTLCDTNIFIEIYRNNDSIIRSFSKIGQENIAVSDVTCAELFFGARNKKELQAIRRDMDKLVVLPNASISESAVKLVEVYSISHKLSLPDAIIAATANYHQIELYTLSVKDIKFLKEVKLVDVEKL